MTPMKKFIQGMEALPFYGLIMDRIQGEAASKDEEAYLFVKEMLVADGLNYGFYPKDCFLFTNMGKLVQLLLMNT